MAKTDENLVLQEAVESDTESQIEDEIIDFIDGTRRRKTPEEYVR